MPVNDKGIIKPLSRRSHQVNTSAGVGHWFGKPCDGGNLMTVSVPIIGRAYVHKRVADAFVGVFGEIAAAGDEHLIDKSDYGGTYNCRNVRGSQVKSPHSWGIAIDLNVHHFRASDGAEVKYGKTNFHCRPDQVAPSLAALEPYFTRWGFTWGGNWNDAYLDPMHFEATEQTVFVLDAGGPEEPATNVASKIVMLPGYKNNADLLFHEGAHYMAVRDVDRMFDEVKLVDRRDEDGKLYFVRGEEEGG